MKKQKTTNNGVPYRVVTDPEEDGCRLAYNFDSGVFYSIGKNESDAAQKIDSAIAKCKEDMARGIYSE